MKRVLVTGANGFIGKRVLKALSRERWAPTVLSRDHAFRAPPGVEALYGDLDTPDSLKNALDNIDAVVHLAAFIPDNLADPAFAEACVRRNGLATLALADAAAKKNLDRFIYVSSGNVYAAEATHPSENSPLYPSTHATYYLASKVLGETYVQHLSQARGLKSAILRIGSVYGHDMKPKSAVATFMRVAAEGGTIELKDGGLATYDLVYVDDIAALIVSALESSAPGIYNAGGGQACTLEQMARTAANTFPERAAQISLLPIGANPFRGFPCLDIAKAKQVFGYAPRSLQEGFASYSRESKAAA